MTFSGKERSSDEETYVENDTKKTTFIGCGTVRLKPEEFRVTFSALKSAGSGSGSGSYGGAVIFRKRTRLYREQNTPNHGFWININEWLAKFSMCFK